MIERENARNSTGVKDGETKGQMKGIIDARKTTKKREVPTGKDRTEEI